MKTESNIDPIRNLIRDNALEPRPNEWFTQRVMSSLPIKKERRSFSWLSVAFYAVAITACAVWWIFAVSNMSLSVITVRDIVYVFVTVIVTILILWNSFTSLFHAF